MCARLTHKLEDCLGVIWELSKASKYVRIKDIAGRLKISPPSVVEMINKLENKGYLIHERYGGIALTNKGKRLALNVFHKHNLYIDFLTALLIPENIAKKDVQYISHNLHTKTLKQLSKFIEFMKTKKQFVKEFKGFKKSQEPRNKKNKIKKLKG